MKLKTLVKLTCVAVLSVFALALGAAVRADGISDSNTTTDGSSGTVNAGQGEVFTCQDSSNSFSCIDTSAFTCFGFDNCLALGATGGALTLGAFLERVWFWSCSVHRWRHRLSSHLSRRRCCFSVQG